MPLPTFLVVGAAKAGTTSLYHYFREHPQVFMSPVKECCYFAYGDPRFEPGFWVNRFVVRTEATLPASA